jgi:xanthine dehydrogenase accessory factor
MPPHRWLYEGRTAMRGLMARAFDPAESATSPRSTARSSAPSATQTCSTELEDGPPRWLRRGRSGEDGRMSDPTCGVAHGSAAAETARDRVLVAVFASPVAECLARYAPDLGYRVLLLEPDAGRRAAADGAGVVAGFADLDADDGLATADVVVTDHHRDELGAVLRDALARPVRWVGVMGKPSIEGPHVAALAALGVPPEEVARVHRPIGLDIGSRTPAEIAISTLAGLLADRNGRSGGFAHEPTRSPDATAAR